MALDTPPTYATARTPSRRTYGPAVGKFAGALGAPLMPWQQRVVDVALEVLEDGSWAYTTVVVTVERQAGKTTTIGPVNLHRATTRPAKCWLTAQSRQDARDTWLDVATRVGKSPLADLFAMRRSNGSEGLESATTGGSFRVFAPTEDALHGKANELVTVDEGWAFDAAQGAALEQAILPTFTTTGGQFWMVSTAGHSGSTWLRGYVERGRAAVRAGVTESVAYFEWSLDDQAAALVEAALTDGGAAGLQAAVEAVFAAHPAAGRTVKRAALVQAFDKMTPAGVLRAYGNVWTASEDRAIPAHLWTAAGVEPAAFAPPRPGEPRALAFDVALDRSSSAVCAAWQPVAGGPVHLDVLDSREGTSWLAPRVRELVERWKPASIGHDGAGPALDVADELARTGLALEPTTHREYVTACAGLLADVVDGRVRHGRHPALDQAVDAAATKTLGDGWAWSRRESAGSIAPLVGATVARWRLLHRPPPRSAPLVVSRRRRSLPPELAGAGL